MLGKLAKWLRVLGYETHYQTVYRPGSMSSLLLEGRRLLTRNKTTAGRYESAILIRADRVGAQLSELREKAALSSPRSKWFTRCLICDTLLKEAALDKAKDSVPEYVFYENMMHIRYCPSCDRYYWPGTHRKRMILQLEEWGF